MRTLLKEILFVKFRILKYKWLSNCNNIKGKPNLQQPALINGLGSVNFGSNTQIGVKNSPKYYNTYAYIEARKKNAQIIIGNNISINNNFCVTAENSTITILDNTLIGVNCQIMDSDFHDLNPENRMSDNHKTSDVTIEKNAFIGNNVIILKGVTIGENSIISAGSIVTRNIPKNIIAGGVPAEFIKKL